MIILLHKTVVSNNHQEYYKNRTSHHIYFISTKNFQVNTINMIRIKCKKRTREESIINFINKSIGYLLNNKLKYRRYVELNNQRDFSVTFVKYR